MNTIHEYLQELKAALAKSDPATIQDALSDAEEYLSNAVEAEMQNSANVDAGQALQLVIEKYGSPKEVAAAYLEAVERLTPTLKPGRKMENRSIFAKFFGVYADSHAWGSLLYMLISLVTGIVYFTWSTTFLSLSISFLIFIFGLFFTLFFLYSLRGVALMEGRIVEALLGERMPRRPLFKPSGEKWMVQLKMLLKDRHTWFTMIYTFMQLPLGVIYFTLVITLISVALAAFAVPVLQYGFHLPVINFGHLIFLPLWSMPFFVFGGALLFTGTLYLAKGIGILHGKWAKLMLVVD
ncbi:MAG: sensor domain-containing protein [Anaerolineaceae bacterium]